jgi:hypothetical protein
MPVAYPRDQLTQELQKLDGRLSPGSTFVSFLQQQQNQAMRDEMAQHLRAKSVVVRGGRFRGGGM